LDEHSSPSGGRAFWCSDVESVARPECVQRGERGGRGDASFVNNTIKGSLTCQKQRACSGEQRQHRRELAGAVRSLTCKGGEK
jgi:hypothetical protein